MGDLTGPIEGCFKTFSIIVIIFFGVLSGFYYYADESKAEKEEQEKKEIYLKGVKDASDIINHKLDSIKR